MSTTLSKQEWNFGSANCTSPSANERGHKLDPAGVWELTRTLSFGTKTDARTFAEALSGTYTENVPPIIQKTWSGNQVKAYSQHHHNSSSASDRTGRFELISTDDNTTARAKTHVLSLPSEAVGDYEEVIVFCYGRERGEAYVAPGPPRVEDCSVVQDFVCRLWSSEIHIKE